MKSILKKLFLLLVLLAGMSLMFTGQAPAQTVATISGGGGQSLFLKSDGSLWGMGYNIYGQLGNGTYNNTNLPELIVASNVTAVAAGAYHSLILKNNGSLWAMGFNYYGQVGDGTYGTTYPFGPNTPEEIVASNVTAVAAGGFHSLFLKADGSLWAMGDNSSGQLGDGTTNNINHPEQILASNVTAIAAGLVHSLILKNDGSLWAMGENSNGQLGDGTYNATNFPEMIVASNVTAIAAGADHSLFLKNDGSLWGMGYNGFGELGDGTTDNGNYQTNHPEQLVASNVTAIAAGDYHSLFLKSNGSLWVMGDNQYGELGDGSYNSTNLPEMVAAGSVIKISGGYGYSLLTKSDGSLWAMGENQYGGLGNGNYNNINLPEQVLPYALYTLNPTNGLAPLTVQFTTASVDSSGNSITNWNWNFGDGTTGTGQNPTHIYNTIGSFAPMLMASNSLGVSVGGAGPSVTVSGSVNNLVVNGGFENNFINSFPGWVISSSGTGGSDIPVTSTVHSGSRAIQFGEAFNNGNPSHTFLFQTIPTQTGANYVISFWLYRNQSNPNFECSVFCNGVRAYDSMSSGGTPQPGWANIQTTVTATEANMQLQFTFDYPFPSGGGNTIVLDDVNVVQSSGYNQVSVQSLGGTNMQLSFYGNDGANYALDRTFSLAPPSWVPQATNPAGYGGIVLFTTTPVPSTNNFWRVRSVP